MDDADDGDWNLDCVELEILDNVRRTSVDGFAFLTHDSWYFESMWRRFAYQYYAGNQKT